MIMITQLVKKLKQQNDMKTFKYFSILAFLSLCICTACTEDIGTEVISHESGYLEVYATIGEASTVQTRADETTENKDRYGVPMDELYSYRATNNGGGFADGCKIGIYSSNTVVDNNNKRLVNVPLTFKKNVKGGYSFINEDISIPSMTNLGRTFAYYPYSESNNQQKESSNGSDLKYPIELYINDNSNSPYPENSGNKNKVIDLLKATNGGSLNSGGMISYTFIHACTMLLIYRGEGFDECQNNKDVFVKLKNRPLAYVYRTGTGNFSLDIDGTNIVGADEEYPTNFCENYQLNTSKPQDVYSVILPPEAEVEYIRLYDNFGTEQYVRPEKTMTLEGENRYTVTVKLDGLYPTIYPHDITKWEDTPVVIDKNIPGIYNFNGFREWISTYNNSDTDRETKLEQYGTKAENGDQWIFHLYADIDLENYDGPFITNFSDKLEAHGHTISNIALQKTADGNVGFVGTLADGSIDNLKIDGISFNDTEEIHNVGTIAGTVTNGSVTNCKITGIDIESEYGNVGALAGTFSSGTVETCLLEGELRLGINAKNETKLFGDINGTYTPDQINTSGVFVFQSQVEPDTGDTDSGDEGSDTEDNTGNDTEGGN